MVSLNSYCDDSKTADADEGVILINVVAPELKPLIYIDKNGDNAGLIIDSINNVNSNSYLDIKVTILPWARAMKRVLNNQADAILPALYTEERSQILSFPELPFINFYPAVLLKRADDDYSYSGFQNIESVTSIAKVRAVHLGESFELATTSEYIRIVEVNRLEDAIKMLMLKRVDLVIADSFVNYTLKSMGLMSEITTINIANKVEPSYLSFSKPFSSLHNINRIMETINTFNDPDHYSKQIVTK